MRSLAGFFGFPGRLRRKIRQSSSDRQPGEKGGDLLKIPVHLAVIMDGNGRWAQKRGLPRQAGHRAGADNLQRVCRLCGKYGIRYLTVYAFSTENWNRPENEVQTLLSLFVEYIRKFEKEMAQEGIRLRFSGDLDAMPEEIRETIRRAEEDSRLRDRLQLIIAMNYGGRRELVQACQKIAVAVKNGEMTTEAVDEAAIQDVLYLPDVPDPDLVIRPSGELRLSNFLLWESAYAELWFSDCLWPDFGEPQLLEALKSYSGRDRRFGRIKKT